jgi:serine/threonine-protein kinase
MASHDEKREQRDVPQPESSERAPSVGRDKRASERVRSERLPFENSNVVRVPERVLLASHDEELVPHDGSRSDSSKSTPSASGDDRSFERILSDGLHFGSYKVVRLIAVGGMSEIYEAIHVGLRKRVALKVMRPDLAANPQAQRSFLAEGMNAARIRHTNVVDVTDVGVVGDLPYLVMSLLDGEDLAAAYAREGRFPSADLVDLLLPVAFAVAIGHSHGVVHRDLKPDNIFLHQEGRRLIPKVLDFGVSRLLGALRTKAPSGVFGTPFYMAPEQARGESSDTRADVYALGVILYQGLTGRLPREADTAEALVYTVAFDSSPFPLPSHYVELPAGLEAVICRALTYDPEQRFASMHDMALALLPFASLEACRYWTEELSSLPNVGPDGHAVAPSTPRPLQPPRPSVPPLSMRTEPSAVGVEQPAPPSTLQPATASMATSQPSAAESPLPAGKSEPTARFTRDWPQLEVVKAGTATVALFAPWRRTLLGLAAAALLALVGIRLIGSSAGGGTTTISAATAPSAPDRSSRYFDVDVRVTPDTAVLLLDEKQVAVGHYMARVLQDDTTHELRAAAEGFVTRSVWFRNEAPQRLLELVPTVVEPVATATPVAPATATTRPAHPAASKTPAPRNPPQKSVVAALRPRATVPLASVDSGRNSDDSFALHSPHVSVIEPQQPKVRTVDDEQPRVRVIE